MFPVFCVRRRRQAFGVAIKKIVDTCTSRTKSRPYVQPNLREGMWAALYTDELVVPKEGLFVAVLGVQ